MSAFMRSGASPTPSGSKDSGDLKPSETLLANQRAKLQDELAAARLSKSALEHLANQQRVQIQELDRELQHFQVQLSRVITERDQALFDCEQARTVTSAQYEQSLSRLMQQLDTEAARRAAVEEQLEAALDRQQGQQHELQRKQAEADEARRQLRSTQEEGHKQEGVIAALQAKLALSKADLERTQHLLHLSHQAETRLRAKLHDGPATSTHGREGASDSAIDELSSLEHQLALSQRQADQANAELARTRLKLRLQAQAMPQGHSAPPMALLPEKPIEEQQLVVMDRQASVGTGGDAVLAHSGVSEDTQAQLDILTRMVHDLKIKLAEATQAKVDALIKLAAAGECAQPSRPQAGVSGSVGHWMEHILGTQWSTSFLTPAAAELHAQLTDASGLAQWCAVQLEEALQTAWHLCSRDVATERRSAAFIATLREELSRRQAQQPPGLDLVVKLKKDTLDLADVGLRAVELLLTRV